MPHGLSHLQDQLLRRWQASNYSEPRLTRVLIMGAYGLRGITDLDVSFLYPVIGIAGANGAGKSTLLACCACAYHNSSTFVPAGLRGDKPYYTFGNFFQITATEQRQEQVAVVWEYSGTGYPPFHHAIKMRKWSHYDKRPERAVQFASLIRALPALERTALRSHFAGGHPLQEIPFGATETRQINRILGGNYVTAGHAHSHRHTLNWARGADFSVTGFNLGAGEDSTFEIFRLVEGLPPGALLVIEELEAGLHPRAQVELVKALLQVSWDRHIQIIFSTHSKTVLETLPPHGRVFLKRNRTIVEPMYNISAEYAFSLMASAAVPELTVYVEDALAQALMGEVLPVEVRTRCRIVHVGSWPTVVAQVSSHIRNPNLGKCVAVLDGDCTMEKVHGRCRALLDGQEAEVGDERIQSHFAFLPGNAPPEEWLRSLFQPAANGENVFLREFRNLASLSEPQLCEVQTAAGVSTADSLVFEVSRRLGFGRDRTLLLMCQTAARAEPEVFESLVQHIRRRLEE